MTSAWDRDGWPGMATQPSDLASGCKGLVAGRLGQLHPVRRAGGQARPHGGGSSAEPLRQLNVRSRTEAVLLAVKHGHEPLQIGDFTYPKSGTFTVARVHRTWYASGRCKEASDV